MTVDNPIANEDEEEDELDHEEVQQENTHVLQQQQQESLDTTRPKRNYKLVQKFGSDKPLRHYGQEEMQSLHKNMTWEVVPLPVGKTVIGCKWVYKRYKARLVAKGFPQKEEVDYNEIFSPVVKHTSIRVLLSLVAHVDLELEQLDVKTAFLHGDLDEEIYMYQPEGYKVE
ncbi:retrotransposon-related protein, partial [Trifolium pratense]